MLTELPLHLCRAVIFTHVLKILFLFKCRLSPCEWSQPQTEQNTFSFLHSLWYTAGALTLQGKQHPSKR